MISVYRVYITRAWHVGGEAGRLLGLLDGHPGFLHSSCGLPLHGPEIEGLSISPRRAVTKLAMAQCHVVLSWADADDPAPEWTGLEIDVARHGFRRAIPVLAISRGGEVAPDVLVRGADAVVDWSSSDIVGALERLAAEARAAQRKADPERDGREVAAEHGISEGAVTAEGRSQRPLPVEEIVVAYETFRAHRGDRKKTRSV